MNFELPMGGIEFPSGRSFLRTVLPNSFTERLQDKMFGLGSLLEGPAPSNLDFVNVRNQVDEVFFDQRVLGFDPKLSQRDLSQATFFGGVCALSTRESTLLKKEGGLVEDPITGERSFALDEDGLNLASVITAPQIFESVGLTANRTAVVLEDTLWSDRVIEKLGADDEISKASVRRVIGERNDKTAKALKALREFLYGEDTKEIIAFKDTALLDALRVGTTEMFNSLGVGLSDDSDYPLVYAGMYSYVWRDIMIADGNISPDDLMVIYEPEKHILPEDTRDNNMTFFRKAFLEQEPYLEPGSRNENIGIISYANAYAGTRYMRNLVPTALLPNSANFEFFDFTSFPIIPKSEDGIAPMKAFGSFSNIGEITLSKNPAFLWGTIYPPTQEITDIMYLMDDLRTRTSMQRTMAKGRRGNVPMGVQMKAITTEAEAKMTELSILLIAELEKINKVIFGGLNESR